MRAEHPLPGLGVRGSLGLGARPGSSAIQRRWTRPRHPVRKPKASRYGPHRSTSMAAISRGRTGCGEGRPLLAGGAGEDVPAVIDKVSLIGSSNSRRAPTVTRPFHVLVTGHPPWADRALRSRVVSCHADHRPPRMHGANFSSPPSPQTVHTSGMAWTSTEVQQYHRCRTPSDGAQWNGGPDDRDSAPSGHTPRR